MLELINLSKKFGDCTAVDGLSLKVENGEIFGLLGPNGAGKSTIVSMIGSFISPTSGEIKIDNISLSKNPIKAKRVMGIVPQDLALYEELSAKDNLEFFGTLYGLSRKETKKRVDEVLDIIELKEKKHQLVCDFSGGMKRRVNIGIALMNNPKLLILDEPTVGIDPQSRNHILETVKRLNEQRGMTVIYTSHYMEEVEFLCKRIAIMDHGKIIALGTKDELKEKLRACDTLTIDCCEVSEKAYESIKVFKGIERATLKGCQLTLLVTPRTQNVIDILDKIRNLGIKISSFKYEEVNLESLFLQVTGKSLRE